jgi:hypothetical protein
MRWFGRGKRTTVETDESVIEAAGDGYLDAELDESTLDGPPATWHVYAGMGRDGQQYLVVTDEYSSSLPILCVGTREICEAFAEGHRMGLNNAMMRTDILVGLVDTVRINAYDTMCGLIDGTLTAQDLPQKLNEFDQLRALRFMQCQDRFIGPNVTDEGDDEKVHKDADSAAVIQISSYRRPGDGAA